MIRMVKLKSYECMNCRKIVGYSDENAYDIIMACKDCVEDKEIREEMEWEL